MRPNAVSHPDSSLSGHPTSRPRWRSYRAATVAAVVLTAFAASLLSGSQAEAGPRATGAYVLAKTWTSLQSGLPADAWRRAMGVDATSDGRTWVSDADERRLTVIGATGQATILRPADGSSTGLIEPGHLAVDLAADRIYVADQGQKAVSVFTLAGEKVTTWRNLPRPAGIAVTPDGNVVVTLGDKGEVYLFSPDGIKLYSWLAVNPSSAGDLIRGVDVDKDGKIFVLDRLGRKVVVFSPDGRKVDTIPLSLVETADVRDLSVDESPIYANERRYWFATSVGLLMYDPKQNDWTAYQAAGNLSAVASDPKVGIVVASPDRRGTGSTIVKLDYGAQPTDRPTRFGGVIAQLGIFEGPQRLTIGADGRAYVLDRSPRVQRFALDGAVLGQMTHPNPAVVDAGPDGSLFVTDGVELMAYEPGSNGRVERWRAPVATTQQVNQGMGGHATGLVYDTTTQKVVVLDSMAGQLKRFDPIDGMMTPFPKKLTEPDDSSVWADLATDGKGAMFALDRSNQTVHTVAADQIERVIQLPAPARQIAVGPGPGGTGLYLFTLNRDGWVRRYDIAGALGPGPAGGVVGAVLGPVFDAGRFDLGPQTRPSDLAVDQAGNVYVSDRVADVVSHFQWDPNAPAQTLPDGATCRGYTDKTASPGEVDFGASVDIQLTLRGGCGSESATDPMDIVLLLDRSGSMAGEKINILREAAQNFVSEVDFTTTKVGVLSFTGQAKVEARLGSQPSVVREALRNLVVDPLGTTSIDAALAAGRDEFNRRGRRDAKWIMVLISDGASDTRLALEEADKAKAADIEIYTIGIQSLGPLLRLVATDDDHYFVAEGARFLYAIFEQILEQVATPPLFRTVSVTDEIPANMRFIVASDVPTATLTGNTLTWRLTNVPVGGIALRYQVQPLAAGEWPTNVRAWADYEDGFRVVGRLDFPVPRVKVRAPNAPTRTPTPLPTDTLEPTATHTPTATPSPTYTAIPSPTTPPTATPRPIPIYLPILLREKCTPGERHADVVLAIDTSNSMAGAPLQAARTAARLFADQLELPKDQIGLVAFNDQATLVIGLTGDRVRLEGAIGALSTQPGTRIHLGLAKAVEELKGPRRIPANTPVLVLLTDGVGQDTQLAIDTANQARAAGIRIFAIGLGSDLDLAILAAISGSATRTYVAPSPAELAAIYRQVAGEVPCPPEAFWGKRAR